MTDFEWIAEMLMWAGATIQGGAPARHIDDLNTAATEAGRYGKPLGWDLLYRRLELSPTEQQTLMLVLATELSVEIAASIGALTGDPRRHAIEIGLVRRLVYSNADAAARFIVEQSPAGALYRYGLVELGDGPFLFQQLRPTRRALEIVHGATRLDLTIIGIAHLIETPAIQHLEIAADIEARIATLVVTAARGAPGEPPVLVLRGPSGSGRRSLLQSVAAKLERACLVVTCARLPNDPMALVQVCRTLVREALLTRAMVVLHELDDVLRDGGDVRAGLLDDHLIDKLPGLVAVTLGRGQATESAATRFARGAVEIDVPLPTERERDALWQRALGPRASDADCAWAAARYKLTGGDLLLAARSALAASGGDVQKEDIHAAVRASLHGRLGTLAERITITQTWNEMVLPADVLDEIAQMMSRIENGALVFDEWGLGDKIGRGFGLSALFSGPPGTGKTMVAGVIAASLGLDLYRIDLSRIVSKYIGETEKNLASLFDAAEVGHAILLFDEADSIFGKRTAVSSSTDRYANLEVNFLLQRLETFTGISILTSNHEAAIDDAFKRRLSFRIAFPLPDAKERARIWEAMLPPKATFEGDLGIPKLAEAFNMSGGYIKNAIVRAAFIAADRGEAITHKHLLRGAKMEYVAMGKIAPAG